MKRTVQSKPSKASLVARGLAARPAKGKRNHKAKSVPEAKASYSLYSTDSEDQVSAVGHGLDRCAVLLTNILDNDSSSDQGRKKPGVAKPAAKTLKPAAKGKQPFTGPRPRAVPVKSRQIPGQAVVIPTAPSNEKDSPSPKKPQNVQDVHRVGPPVNTGPATLYNDRLVASTPVLNADERHRQHELLQREQDLTRQLQQLKQHYELLQQQQSPELQEQQKRRLQSAMLHELDDYQQSQPTKPTTMLPHSTTRNSLTSESNVVLDTGQDLLSRSSSRTPRTRRSLEYTSPSGELSDFKQGQSGSTSEVNSSHSAFSSRSRTSGGLQAMNHTAPSSSHLNSKPGYPKRFIEKGVDHGQMHKDPDLSNDYSSFDRRDRASEPSKKQVRIVSPSLQERYTPSAGTPAHHSSTALSHYTVNAAEHSLSPKSPNRRPRSAPPTSRGGLSPSAMDNPARTIQYLTRELRELIEDTGDLEVERLLMEIDHATALLPYMYTSHSPQSAIDGEIAAQPLRLENVQLRRKLRITNQKLKEKESLGSSAGDVGNSHNSITFELTGCRSENAALQTQLQEERQRTEKLRQNITNLEKNVADLKEDKKKFMFILENKEHNYTKDRRSSQLESSRLSVEVKQLKAELEASNLSSEATRKENVILNLSLKQKDAEVERLGELTRGLQQSMRRVLIDIQEYHPDSVVKDNLLRHPDVLGQIGVIQQDHPRPTKTSRFPITPRTLASEAPRHASSQSHNPWSYSNTDHRPLSTANGIENDNHRTGSASYTPRDFGTDDWSTNYNRSFVGLKFSTSKAFQGFSKENNPRLSSEEPKYLSPTHESSRTSPGGAKYSSPGKSPEGPAYLNTRASLGLGSRVSQRPPYSLSPGIKDLSADLSSLSSKDEEEFQRDLASLDADIARIQRSLRETALKT